MLTWAKPIETASIDLDDVEVARKALDLLAHHDPRQGVRVEAASASDSNSVQSVILPAPAVRVLLDVLSSLADGRTVPIVRDNGTLTTSQAAAVLGVSRPYFVRLLDQDALPYTRVGTHRRIAMPDLLTYAASRRKASGDAADALTRQAQELDMGY